VPKMERVACWFYAHRHTALGRFEFCLEFR
jgi:hypothetical protein